MIAKIGDLAVAVFDEKDVVCIITGKFGDHFNFFYWEKRYIASGGINISIGSLPTNRFTRVRPKGKWNGNILKLTPNNVEPPFTKG